MTPSGNSLKYPLTTISFNLRYPWVNRLKLEDNHIISKIDEIQNVPNKLI